MDISALRPVLSGLIGAAIAVWALRKVAKWVPTTCGGRPISEVTYKHRWKVRSANTVGFAALLGGVALYKFDVFPNNDWHGLGLAFGAACMLPALILTVTSILEGPDAIRESFVAYAVGQDTPPALLNGIMAAGIIVFFVTVGSMYGG
jgi:hypothetical protein